MRQVNPLVEVVWRARELEVHMHREHSLLLPLHAGQMLQVWRASVHPEVVVGDDWDGD